MRVVENHGARILTISDTNRLKRVVDGQEANSPVVELVDTLEVEDLEIYLANKEVYRLIDKANEAECYYDQAKSQPL